MAGWKGSCSQRCLDFLFCFVFLLSLSLSSLSLSLRLRFDWLFGEIQILRFGLTLVWDLNMISFMFIIGGCDSVLKDKWDPTWMIFLFFIDKIGDILNENHSLVCL